MLFMIYDRFIMFTFIMKIHIKDFESVYYIICRKEHFENKVPTTFLPVLNGKNIL